MRRLRRRAPDAGRRKNAEAARRSPDALIEAAIRAKFAKSKINADKFQVHVQGGVATIEGKTDVIQHKGVATRMAKTAGAVAVNNHVQISDAAKQKAAANLAEAAAAPKSSAATPAPRRPPPPDGPLVGDWQEWRGAWIYGGKTIIAGLQAI